MKILYLCQHPANILVALVHKLKYHDNEKSDLIYIPEGRQNSPKPTFPTIENFRCHDLLSSEDVSNWLNSENYGELINNSETICGKVFSNLKISPKEYQTYFLFDWIPLFSLYYYQHNLSYSIIAFNKNYLRPFGFSEKFCNQLNQEIHYIGIDSKLCTSIFGPNDIRDDLNDKIRLHEFSMVNDIIELDNAKHSIIKNAYKICTLCLKETRVLVLLNSLGFFGSFINAHNLNSYFYNTSPEFIMVIFYKMTIDYFINEMSGIVIKCHPSFSDSTISEFSRTSTLIPAWIPIEVLACDVDLIKHIKFFCPIYSTSVNLGRTIGCDCLELGNDSVTFFRSANFIRSSLDVLKTSPSFNQIIYIYGIDIILCRTFLNSQKYDGIIIKQLNKENHNEANFIIADNVDNNFYTLVSDNCNNIMLCIKSIPFKFKHEFKKVIIKTISNKNEHILKDQLFYIYSIRQDNFSRPNKLALNYSLPITEAFVSVFSLDIAYYCQIRVLIQIYLKFISLFRKVDFYKIDTSIDLNSICDNIANSSYSTNSSWSLGEGSFNIADYFNHEQNRYRIHTEEFILLESIIKQYWKNTLDCIINFDYSAWNKTTLLNNPKMNRFGKLIKITLSKQSHYISDFYILVYCKYDQLYRQIDNSLFESNLGLGNELQTRITIFNLNQETTK